MRCRLKYEYIRYIFLPKKYSFRDPQWSTVESTCTDVQCNASFSTIEAGEMTFKCSDGCY